LREKTVLQIVAELGDTLLLLLDVVPLTEGLDVVDVVVLEVDVVPVEGFVSAFDCVCCDVVVLSPPQETANATARITRTIADTTAIRGATFISANLFADLFMPIAYLSTTLKNHLRTTFSSQLKKRAPHRSYTR
jgi:hypothetical protein